MSVKSEPLYSGMEKKKISLLEATQAIELLSIDDIKTLTPVEETTIARSALMADRDDKLILADVLNIGLKYKEAGLTPMYLYDTNTQIFTVTSTDFFNSKMH